MMKALIIVGAGEFGHVVKELAESLGYDKIGFLDDNSPEAIGKVADFETFVGEYEEFVVSIGNPAVRERLYVELSGAFAAATLVSPRAYVSPSAVLGSGCIVEPMAVVNTGATVGVACIINAGAVVNHNAVVEDFCQVDCGAVVGARECVKKGTKVR